mmetsp:Transcript_18394/g.31400  ORF Transcript_18394/g.31400 Transcript_18394/m.31400 type:complete len:345 (+) Transcript_18394:1122-2156(+)
MPPASRSRGKQSSLASKEPQQEVLIIYTLTKLLLFVFPCLVFWFTSLLSCLSIRILDMLFACMLAYLHACLFELFLKDGCKVFCDLECLDGNANGGNSLGRGSIDGVLGDTLLDGDVVRILGEEIRHGLWVLLLESLDVGLVFFVGHVVTEDLLSGGVGDHTEGIGSSTSVGLDAHFVSVLGLDGELNLVEIGIVLSAGSWEGLHGGEFLVGGDALDVIDGDIVEGDKKGEFVDGHVLEHTLGVTFKAFSETLGGVFVGIVGDKGDVGSGVGGGEFTGLAHVFADVLVVSHQHLHTGGLGFVHHGLELGHCWGTRLLEVDALGSPGNGFGQKTWIVGSTSTDKG